MASPDLRQLWKLHLVDAAIQDIRNKAAHMDVGQKIQAEIDKLTAAIADHPYKKLHTEQQDLELQQKTIDDKVAKFEQDLYSGKIVNPREVEAFQKEIGILKRQRSDLDERLLAIYDEVPTHQAEADKLQSNVAKKKEELLATQQRARTLKTQLESDFKTKSAQRPELAKAVNPSLLARYEDIRKRHHGVGMAEVVKRKQCGACGTLLPERTLQACLDDKTVTCETCHRILYYTEGVV